MKVTSKKMYEVYHYIYGDVCSDSFYGKSRKKETVGIYNDTEDNIKTFVAILNNINHSYYPEEDPEHEDDLNADYYAYKEIKPMTVYESLSNAIDTTLKKAFDKIQIK